MFTEASYESSVPGRAVPQTENTGLVSQLTASIEHSFRLTQEATARLEALGCNLARGNPMPAHSPQKEGGPEVGRLMALVRAVRIINSELDRLNIGLTALEKDLS